MVQKKKTIKGFYLAPPKITLQGIIMLLKYIALPVLTGLLFVDIIFYAVFKFGFDTCYGILCAAK